jgi:hypothetical protein
MGAPAPITTSPFEACHAVFGERPRDVLFHIDTATDGLSWCEAIFLAIEVLHENGGEIYIRRLANVGYYIAESIGANVMGERDQMQTRIEAAEAQEGGAA